jgi:hypothetical protein
VHVETSAVPLGTTRGGTVRARETSVWSGDMRVVPFMVQQEVGRSGSICFLLHLPGGPAVSLAVLNLSPIETRKLAVNP